MTLEQYSRATDIMVDIDVIYELQHAIGNATEGKFLCAAKTVERNPTTGIYEGGEIMNYARLPKHIKEKFEQILKEELKRLEREFAEL